LVGARPQPPGLAQVTRQALELATAIGALAIDQVLRGRVDRHHAVELAQDRILRRPEVTPRTA
jgi:hypothetical protein